MRIIRDNNPHDDDNDRNRRKKDQRLDEMAADVPEGEMGNVIADEVAGFLAAVNDAADNHGPQPETPTEPDNLNDTKPLLRLVPDTDATTGIAPVEDHPVEEPEKPTQGAGVSDKARLWGSTAATSAVVVAGAAVVGWGQPAAVLVPAAGYGAAWVAYLWWNAALRPPITQALAAIATAVARSSAAAARTLLAAVRWLSHRTDTGRDETTRTALTSNSRPADVA